jgi:hypothetical protein
MLSLVFRHVDGVDCDYAVSLVGEEARSIVRVDDGGAGEDAFGGAPREEGDGLVGPGVEVGACGVAPVLVAGYILGFRCQLQSFLVEGWVEVGLRTAVGLSVEYFSQKGGSWKSCGNQTYIGSTDDMYHFRL